MLSRKLIPRENNHFYSISTVSGVQQQQNPRLLVADRRLALRAGFIYDGARFFTDGAYQSDNWAAGVTDNGSGGVVAPTTSMSSGSPTRPMT